MLGVGADALRIVPVTDAFTMDVRSPLSPLFAFCMSVAALERKLPLAFEL